MAEQELSLDILNELLASQGLPPMAALPGQAAVPDGGMPVFRSGVVAKMPQDADITEEALQRAMPMMPSHAPPRPAYPAADRYDARMASGRQALTKATSIGPHPEPSMTDRFLNAATGYPLPGEVATGG